MNFNSEADQKFQVRRQGRRLGPFNRTQIDRMISRQQLGPKDEISLAGNNQWQRVDQWQLDHQPAVNPGAAIDQSITHAAAGDESAGNAQSTSQSAKSESVGDDWYVAIDGNRQGPIDEHTLGRWISERRINAETLVWRSGMQAWKSAREVLPAALVSAATGNPESDVRSPSATNGSADRDYALRDLRSRRGFWMLAVCIITYIFAAESFAVGLFQIYTAVATRRVESGGLIALWAVSGLVFAGLLLMTAIELTKLIAKSNRPSESQDPVTVAKHEHRVWLFAGLSAAFIIANQIVFAIFLLITIAQAT